MTNENLLPWIKTFIDEEKPRVLILLADGFDDLILTFVAALRNDSIPVSLVGFSNRQTRSAHGVSINSDLSLDETFTARDCSLLIVPNSDQIKIRILIEPRVHILINDLLRQGAYILAAADALAALRLLLGAGSEQLIAWP